MCDPQIHFSLLMSLATIPSEILIYLSKPIKTGQIIFLIYLIIMKSSQTGYLEGHIIGTFGILFLSVALLWGRLKEGG